MEMTATAKKRYIGVLAALALLILVSGISFVTRSSSSGAALSPATGPASDRPAGASLQPQAAGGVTGPTTGVAYRGILPVAHFDVSPPLRSLKADPASTAKMRENEDRDGQTSTHSSAPTADKAVQKLLGPFVMPTPILSFDGPSNLCGGCTPPDPNGEVGTNHVVVMDNLHFQIFNKTGTSLLGPTANNTLWAGFGGECQTQNAGDPVVLYDQLADRWLLSQFTSAGPTYFNCVALSTTPDPTGTYYRWAFTTGNNFPDYPKYGMWPDAYYISTREFAGGSTFAGVGAYAGNRTQMLAGNPNPQVISFLAPGNPSYNVGDGLLPADLDGTTLPPAGSPEYFVGSMDDGGGYGAPQDALTLWKFVANFASPPSSSFTLANTLPIAPYNTIFALCAGGRNCIPQPGTANRIDILSYRQRPLFRLAYRNMGTFETLVTNQSVSAGTGPSGEVAGIRWWELRSPNASPVVFQEGTYAPGLTDGINRWMGAIAMDHVGNMGLAYSVSNATVFPGIRYTGRLAGDPLGLMPQGEASIIEGTGSQTSAQRWGDYTDTTVDPVDDCTFWHVNEYVPTTSASGWRLRIGAFKFPNCTTGPTPTPCPTCPTATRTRTPTVTSTATQTPCVPGYGFTTTTGIMVLGTTDIGNHGDDIVTTVPLPFPFSLYGVPYSTASLSSNGNLQFVTTSTAFTNGCLPVTAMGPSIMAFWDDQRTDTTLTCSPGPCGIFTAVNGTAPNRIFTIEWRTAYFSGGGSANYEIRLFETANNFDIVIGTLGQNAGGTVGVQDGSTAFTQYACNAPVGNSLRIAFATVACTTPVPTNTPTVTSTPTITSIPTQTPCVPGYAFATSAGTIVAGITDIGNHADDIVTNIALPFPFSLYGVAYATANASSNGNLQFVTASTAFSNACLPVAALGPSILPFWDDQRTDTALTCTPGPCGIFTSVSGTAPNRVFNIEWRTAYFSGGGSANYEIRLFELSSDFDVIIGTLGQNAGGTVGVQNGASAFTQYACNTAVGNGLRIAFSIQTCITPTPEPTDTPTVEPSPTEAPMLDGHVTWQGRPAQPNALQALPISLTLKLGATENDYAIQDTDANGHFLSDVSGLSDGTYNWRVKGPKYLANCGTVGLAGAPTTSQEMGLMRAGDCNNDNIVSIVDFNILKNSFGRTVGNPGYDDRADFTGDQTVNISDFNLQKQTFGVNGCAALGPILANEDTGR
jgi:hypothetical protein